MTKVYLEKYEAINQGIDQFNLTEKPVYIDQLARGFTLSSKRTPYTVNTISRLVRENK